MLVGFREMRKWLVRTWALDDQELKKPFKLHPALSSLSCFVSCFHFETIFESRANPFAHKSKRTNVPSVQTADRKLIAWNFSNIYQSPIRSNRSIADGERTGREYQSIRPSFLALLRPMFYIYLISILPGSRWLEIKLGFSHQGAPSSPRHFHLWVYQFISKSRLADF